MVNKNTGEEIAAQRIKTLCIKTAAHMLTIYPNDFIERAIYRMRRLLPLRVYDYVPTYGSRRVQRQIHYCIYHWTSLPDCYFDGNCQTELYDKEGRLHLITIYYNIGAAIASTLTPTDYSDIELSFN